MVTIFDPLIQMIKERNIAMGLRHIDRDIRDIKAALKRTNNEQQKELLEGRLTELLNEKEHYEEHYSFSNGQ